MGRFPRLMVYPGTAGQVPVSGKTGIETGPRKPPAGAVGLMGYGASAPHHIRSCVIFIGNPVIKIESPLHAHWFPFGTDAL